MVQEGKIKSFTAVISEETIAQVGAAVDAAHEQERAGAASKIAFISVRDGNMEIYVMDPDGSNQVNITNNPDNDSFPTWSPDGARIAFQSNRDGDSEIYVMDADGSNQTRLTNNSDLDVQPNWSPDGSKIAFASRKGAGLMEIYVMNADGSNLTRLTTNDAVDESPSWSPDGSKIASISTRDTGHGEEIYVMDPDGSNLTRLTTNDAGDGSPAWSPDGSKIAFASTRDRNPEIYVMDADGSNQTNLTNSDAHDWRPTWSPDGTKIAFDSSWRAGREDDAPDVYVMNADGTNETRLTTDPAPDGFPDWSPAGVTIAVKPTPTPAHAAPTPTPAPTIGGLKLVSVALAENSESPLAGVYVHGDYAYVGSQSVSYYPPHNKTGIRILDLSDPANPKLVARIPLRSFEPGTEDHSHGDAVATRIETAAFKGDVAIVGHGVADTFTVADYPNPWGIWDVTDPTNPQFLSMVNLGEYSDNDTGGDLGDKPNDSKAVHGHLFYAIYDKAKGHDIDFHMAVVDLSNPHDPVVIGDWADTRDVRLMGLSLNKAGTRAYVVGITPPPFGREGKEIRLYILDVRDPTNPTEIGRYIYPYPFAETHSPGASVANDDDSLLVFLDGSWGCGRTGRLHLLDISDVESIHRISVFKLEGSDLCHATGLRVGHATEAVIKGNLVYSVWLEGGLRVTDISDPTNTVEVGMFLSPNERESSLSDVALYGDYVLAAAVWAEGLYILR